MPTKKNHFSMIRGFHLADWFTLANAGSGMAAVFAAMASLSPGRQVSLLLAVAFIPAAFVFDVLDGRIARWRQQQSALGRELDSLADVISFGVAPAAIAFAAGMNGFWDCIVLGYFVCCGVSRLARYNITAEALSQDSGKVKYFEGTPIPTSLILVLVIGVAVWMGRSGADLWLGGFQLGPWGFHPLVLLYALSGSLMISKTLRIPKL
ncbi:CDP-alcohol phosphatidyltransferase family protein [Tahibacter amnicola]|uniref:CDP-alcohol phosphatidyltransferase family protein n=1 Tax=Tahibacter amnicola TaxID=2976241 RepID=A0ABY6BAY0_9GAMM|nr:CDP-alcohol phosphatidyltransferase family protein [Tahibacter amnicola]UXI67221.1 CDP-alcohol phosphatidyltransferase family protein [Tahibacter amnicola]